MFKQTISISCCLDVTIVAFLLLLLLLLFLITKPRKKLEVDVTHVNKTKKASFNYFLAIFN